MRIDGLVTTVSWIPSESVSGALYRVPFEMGLCHYDNPPPDVLLDVDVVLKSDGARFINRLQAWIDVEDGVVLKHGHSGTGLIGSTRLRLGRHDLRFAAIALPDRRRAERVGTNAVRFEQTTGGRKRDSRLRAG